MVGLGSTLIACRQNPDSPSEEPRNEIASEPLLPTEAEMGTLELWANGEAFIREGFVSKDGWALSFNQVYVTLADITAYQTDPPFEPESDGELQVQTQVGLPGPITVNLVSTPEERALLGSLTAPAGHYNALSWRMVPAVFGPATGYSLWIQGSAQGDPGETIDFVLKFPQELAFTCGEYVGEERKGFVTPDQTADLEATFHFDHLFGDGELPPEDSLNQSALGFAPLAALAVQGSLEMDWASLQEKLSPAEADSVVEILRGLGHVGEGHCRETAARP
ncbi:DUF4382 domain-containing protein [Synechococcus bigranulatus str. 'Rupite']|uniref:DUF4382 domain-containing protein n=2 Tax=Thermostichus vulcanus TaxID=32053 RepID=A0ABT0C6J8_THEVL|nr:DUF4382 domain-containing protein [Thermostichus vulcanus str. 'Rupite']